MFDNNANLDLTCPQCSNKWSVRLGDLRKSPTTCPKCGIEIETTAFDQDMADAEKRLKDFGKGFR